MNVRACTLHSAHDLRIEDRPVGEPGPGEVLVRLRAGGICGSDLHYFHEGRIGPIVVREPLVLGHEVAGVVERAGDGVEIAVGSRVALNPSRPCGRCRFCRRGEQQHCLDMWFYGSAMRFPHSQGAFQERIVAKAWQCEPIGNDVSFGEAACAEPLAVCLHAGRRAGDIAGRRVLVTGAGPIGNLCVAVARFAGAAEIIVTDLHDEPLATARALGATTVVNVAADRDGLAAEEAEKGRIDVAFECSGAAPALAAAIRTVRPGGTIVQVGLGGEVALPLNMLVNKEIALTGSFRFHAEYPLAARLIASRRIDVRPLISDTLPLADAVAAFERASDRRRAMKVQLAFD